MLPFPDTAGRAPDMQICFSLVSGGIHLESYFHIVSYGTIFATYYFGCSARGKWMRDKNRKAKMSKWQTVW